MNKVGSSSRNRSIENQSITDSIEMGLYEIRTELNFLFNKKF